RPCAPPPATVSREGISHGIPHRRSHRRETRPPRLDRCLPAAKYEFCFCRENWSSRIVPYRSRRPRPFPFTRQCRARPRKSTPETRAASVVLQITAGRLLRAAQFLDGCCRHRCQTGQTQWIRRAARYEPDFDTPILGVLVGFLDRLASLLFNVGGS